MLVDAIAKFDAFVPQLTDFPIACFTEASLKEAGRTFEYFPKMKPLADFLAAERGRLRETVRRCRLIASGQQHQAPPQQAAVWTKPTPAEAAERDRIITEAKAQAQQAVMDPNWIWHARMRELHKTGRWYENVCPPPGHPGCQVPDDVLRAWGMQ